MRSSRLIFQYYINLLDCNTQPESKTSFDSCRSFLFSSVYGCLFVSFFFFLPSHIHSFCSAVLVSCKIYHQMHAEVTKLTKQSQNLHYARFERIEMNMNTILIRSVIVCFRYQMNWIVFFFFLMFGLKFLRQPKARFGRQDRY